VVSFLVLNQAHSDHEVLNEHVDSVVVFSVKGDDNVSVLHSGLDEVIVGWLNEAIVLGEHVDHSAATISDVSLNCR
jgi:hypothetical protein